MVFQGVAGRIIFLSVSPRLRRRCRRGRRPREFRLVDARKMRRSTTAALSERGYNFPPRPCHSCARSAARPVPDLVGSTPPRPYHFRALIQSFQVVAAPFPGDSGLPSASRAAIPATEAPRFKKSTIGSGLLRRVSRVENARLARRATRASRLPPCAGRSAGPWNGLAQNRDSFPIL